MSDILIRGISLAECFGKTIEIGRDADGDVFAYVDNGQTAVLDVSELPPHGDLIDKDAFIAEMKKNDTYQNWLFRKMFEKQPVVVAAERREKDGD